VYKISHHGSRNLFYDSDMLDELDVLASRIEKLVGRLNALTQESAELRQSLTTATSERDRLAAELQAEKAQQVELKQSLGSAQSVAQQTKTQAAQEQAALQGTLDLFRQENESMQSSLKTREDEVRRLREVNELARQRIDGVLEKLPGATAQENG